MWCFMTDSPQFTLMIGIMYKPREEHDQPPPKQQLWVDLDEVMDP